MTRADGMTMTRSWSTDAVSEARDTDTVYGALIDLTDPEPVALEMRQRTTWDVAVLARCVFLALGGVLAAVVTYALASLAGTVAGAPGLQ